MLIIQHNLIEWSEGSEKIISKKHVEMILVEYFWSYLEREWNNVVDAIILDSQTKFDEVSNKVFKVLRNSGSFLNDLAGNEPLALPHTLWFGVLDLAYNLVKKSIRTATYGLCYYLAIESLNRAPNSFIQFKATEILLHLHNIDNELFSMIELDFDQYTQKLKDNNSLTNHSEKFQSLLTFVKEKYSEDLKIINDSVGKTKGKGKEKCLTKNTSINNESYGILDYIANEITCPISQEPTDQLCILGCQHVISLNSLKKLKQAKCPQCRQTLENNKIRYLSQNTIYKNLYSQFFKAGHILPSIDSGNLDNSDSDNTSEIDLILTKKRKFIQEIRFNPKSLQSIFQIRTSRK